MIRMDFKRSMSYFTKVLFITFVLDPSDASVVAYRMNVESKSLPCSVKHPYHMKVGEPKEEFHSGCSVVDLTFPNLFYVEVNTLYI